MAQEFSDEQLKAVQNAVIKERDKLIMRNVWAAAKAQGLADDDEKLAIEIGKKIGVDRSYVIAYHKGRKGIGPKTMARFCLGLGMSAHELMSPQADQNTEDTERLLQKIQDLEKRVETAETNSERMWIVSKQIRADKDSVLASLTRENKGFSEAIEEAKAKIKTLEKAIESHGSKECIKAAGLKQ